MTETGNTPDLSVIVTIVDGGDALERCLDALCAQENAPSLEVIIPFDSTVATSARLAAKYPAFRFLDIGVLADRAPENAYEEHELFDRRRTAGLEIAVDQPEYCGPCQE